MMTRLPIGPLRCLYLHVRGWSKANPLAWRMLAGVLGLALAGLVLGVLASVAWGADPIPRLLDAIRQVESGGDDSAVGDKGRAVGPYQIWRCYWTDANMPDGCYEDCRDRAYSERVIMRYWARHCPKALRGAVLRTLAVTHRLGPHPHRAPKAAATYWNKVKHELGG